MFAIELILTYSLAALQIILMIFGCVALYKIIKCCNKYLSKE